MKSLLILVALALVSLIGLSLLSARTPDALGLEDGRLRDCPGSDNCVSSQASDLDHRVDPIPVNGPSQAVMEQLALVIASMDGQVVEQRGDYLHAVFTSQLWRFRDDLECLYDEARSVIQVRSSSRVGLSDFGVNRKRVEILRERLAP